MISGRDAMTTVEQAIGRVRADEGQLDSALRSAMEQAAMLRRAEADGFRRLARVKLDAATRDRLIGTLDASESAALAMIEEHRRRLADLAQRREAARQALERAEAAKRTADQSLADALDRLDDARHATMQRIAGDTAWQQAKAALDAAREIAGAAADKAAQAERDLAEKRKPYESDPLFMYLWDRRHGQAEDHSTGLARTIDRWVAELVGYRDARANYAMLQEIPLRLREHADNKQREVEARAAALAAIERAALVADGIAPVEAAVETARVAAQTADAAVAAAGATLAGLDQERDRAVGAGDRAVYDEAVEMLAQALAARDLRDLYDGARRTPSPADDQAVGAITETRRQLQSVEVELTRLRDTIRDTAARRTELEQARERARRSGYDDPRGRFDGGTEIIGDIVGGILKGVLQGADLDRVLRGGWRGPPRRSDPDFGGRGSGPSWPGGPWGGGSGGGRPWGDDDGPGRSSGGGGGGGWRTGGGF
jgi:hypothetical protein